MRFVSIVDKFILGNMNRKVNMRKDGRKNNELRPVKFTKDFTKNAPKHQFLLSFSLALI